MLKQAGWVFKDRKLVNAETGRPFSFEILLSQPVWERIALPFAKNLERLGIEARVRTVDAAQYQKRTEEFDFDMTVDVFGQSLSPGNEQRDLWGSEAAARQGSRNTIGIKDKAVDRLIELVISAPDRDSLIHRTRALDRGAAVGPLPDSPLAHPEFSRGLLGHVRKAGGEPEVCPRIRFLVDRNGQGPGPWRNAARATRAQGRAAMLNYILRRLLLIIPTLFGIMVVNFVIVQAAPGGPVDRMIAEIKGTAADATARISGAGGSEIQDREPAQGVTGSASKYRGARGLDPELIKELERLYGFDKPAPERFFHMMKSYVVFRFRRQLLS